MTISPTL